MLRKQASNGAIDGAFIVLFGILLGALITLVIQHYAKQIADVTQTQTITKYNRIATVMNGRAKITRDDGR